METAAHPTGWLVMGAALASPRMCGRGQHAALLTAAGLVMLGQAHVSAQRREVGTISASAVCKLKITRHVNLGDLKC